MRSITKWAAPMAAMLAATVIAACASSGGSGGASPQISETFRFADVKSVFVVTPIEVRLRSGAGGGTDMRSLENSVAEALREHLRQDFGWTSARTAEEAGVTAHFQLTDWESGNEGTRVGGTVTLQSPSGERVFTATTVYPSRYGAGAPGPQIENLPNLFRTLFKPLKDR